MANDMVFSWAESKVLKRLVHVDSVPNGKGCGCECPVCHEPVIARHGDVNEHGFAHHSKERQARLEICYMVTLYKLAEQIIQDRKKIILPSYHGIFKGGNVEFHDVKVDSQYERADKQPDIIATSLDGTVYLIEFIFNHKVQHKKAIDYCNMNCIAIDLSGQTLESIEDFLVSEPTDAWQWMNNQRMFDEIPQLYAKAGKDIRVVDETECVNCRLSHQCCAVYSMGTMLRIENNGRVFRLCKPTLFKSRIDELEARLRKQKEKRIAEKNREAEGIAIQPNYKEWRRAQEDRKRNQDEQRKHLQATKDPLTRSCFHCEYNLSWGNSGNKARCGIYITLHIPPKNDPSRAIDCPRYKLKL